MKPSGLHIGFWMIIISQCIAYRCITVDLMELNSKIYNIEEHLRIGRFTDES